MKRYDDIVVGSGISGMTLALLLGLNGRSVLLLEKSPQIGGSMARFQRRKIPLDTGFHFTGAFHENGILQEMLAVLGFQAFVFQTLNRRLDTTASGRSAGSALAEVCTGLGRA